MPPNIINDFILQNPSIVASHTCSRKWLASGITAVVFLGIIAMLFVIAGIAFAMYWFLPKLKPTLKRRCMVGGSCDDGPLKVGVSSGGNGTGQSTNAEISIQATLPVESFHFSIQILRDATDNFCEMNIVVDGISGTVYRGELCNGTMVAIQRLPVLVSCSQEVNEFQAKISILAKVRHTHLVILLGYCIDGNDVLLVYEYEHLGTLSWHLVAWRELGSTPLSWATRLNIALDVARGLEFLHGMSTAQHTFIHGYLKSSNVLLSYEYRAKVSDYGLLVLKSDLSAKTRSVVDTQDYLPPEYHDATGSLTKKTDVFSFGLMLMELIMGSKAFDRAHAQVKTNWATLFKTSIDDDDEFLQFQSKYLDKAMVLGSENTEGIRAVAKLALNCMEGNVADRPEMSYVINTLSFLLGRMSIEQTQREDTDVDMSLSEAVKKWQAFDESSISSETFQVAKCPLPHPKSTAEAVSPKEMESSYLPMQSKDCKTSEPKAESHNHYEEQISSPIV